MSTKVLIIFCTFVYLHSSALAQVNTTQKKLASLYAKSVGQVNFYEKVLKAVNTKCSTNFTIQINSQIEFDYWMRHKTDYSYIEFINFFGNEKATNLLVEKEVNYLIDKQQICLNRKARFILHGKANAIIEENVLLIKKTERLHGLPPINRSEEFLLGEFRGKLATYKNLPIMEIRDIAQALNTRSYSYSIFSYTHKIKIDIEKSLELWRFIKSNSQQAQFIFEYAAVQEKTDRIKALALYKESAHKGYEKAQAWLGIYYACNNNRAKALDWLNKAKLSLPQYVSNTVKEIDMFGEPSECMNGWVY